ncbi:MAG: hypothetical protein IPK50_10325 [Fibrobacterota bacterium]|nr:hypothetical protein [Fibrobacterota bacterium]QQS07272.1 MAG: hypothetical protein IPK50_10325 [Fibrobacterota bacterium]
MSFLPFLSCLLIGSLALVGIAIGMFYRKKFGDSTHGWTLGVGAMLGIVGSALQGWSSLVGNLVMLTGGIFLVVGAYWLWYVMLGSRK